MKTLIIGGVAAGASAAARLRRLDEAAEIILFERGEFISYANCGLPYHLGGKIPQRDSLLVMSPEKFADWFNIEVRTQSEVIAIDRNAKTVRVRNREREYNESYDNLILATGSTPVDQPVPGSDDPRVRHLWTLADMDRIEEILSSGAKKALVVGAGFIGLETAENLNERGLDVTLVQRSGHVLPTIDTEMSTFLAQELANSGIHLVLQQTITAYETEGAQLWAVLKNGERLEADVVIVGTGVRPNSELAQHAGLECGTKGHILVNDRLQTSDPDIYAAGDAIEVVDPIFGGKTAIPLAGPANRQGRIVADNIAGGNSTYGGTLGASVVKVGNLTAGSVGWTEARLTQAGRAFQKIYLHPASNAGYFPGGSPIHMKWIFDDEGTILGVQMVGGPGVDKRIDDAAQAMRGGLKMPALGTLEFAYAPPYNSAKDPINFAGFIATNVLTGLSRVVHADTIPEDALILDVREPAEHELGAIPGAVNIRLGDLRARLNELDPSRKIVACCQVGLRGYLAERILRQNGFDAYNLSGGYTTWKMFHPEPLKALTKTRSVSEAAPDSGTLEELDVRGLPCPGPVIQLKKTFTSMESGERRRVLAAASFENDLVRWVNGNGHQLLDLTRQPDGIAAVIQKAVSNEPVCTTGCARADAPKKDSAAIVLFSNDLDKALAAMIIANGFAASGVEVSIFFTFWGLTVLRKTPDAPPKKDFLSRMFGWMLPNGPHSLKLSKMNMAGLGTEMMKKVMREKNVLTLPQLIRAARENGVRFIACEMAMDVMGLTRDELMDVDEVVSVAAFVELAKEGHNTLFI